MMTIHKYTLPVGDDVVVSMPELALVLSVYEQEGQLCVWAIVDTERPKEARRFFIRVTGHPLGDLLRKPFIGTVVMRSGVVLHVFDGGGKA